MWSAHWAAINSPKSNPNGIDYIQIVLEKAESHLKNLLIAIVILSLEDEAMHHVRGKRNQVERAPKLIL